MTDRMTSKLKRTVRRPRKVRAAQIHQVRLVRALERPFDAVIEITTANGQQHFILPETKADELGEKLQQFAAQVLAPAGHA